MNGLFAAVATPIDAGGRVDLATFDRLLEFLLAAGVDGVVVGGATGEYPHFQMRERAELIRRAADRMPRNQRLLAGIGGPSLRRVIKLGRTAIEEGAESLLLPAPFFFRYEQDDLRAYFSHVSREVTAPCLLYDLPDFTNPIAPATIYSLLREEQHIVGIKDSSGQAENIETFAAERQDEPWILFVGDDRLMARGVKAGWNGGISGLAGFCPELMVRLYRSVVERADQRDGPARGAGARADRAHLGFSDTLGCARRARRPRHGYGPSSITRHSTPPAADRGVQRLVPALAAADLMQPGAGISDVLNSEAAPQGEGERQHQHHDAREAEQRP